MAWLYRFFSLEIVKVERDGLATYIIIDRHKPPRTLAKSRKLSSLFYLF
jgi:hypothetical protein